ncbi:radical SAM protein [Helicobacter trogontum]|uniref:radical SAM protein n=1 Tax=Helicobacter trogontum TaxID=50960 RepID=UPI000CF1A3E5|nr:radical SAM protein [Helicobacter trogontum]
MYIIHFSVDDCMDMFKDITINNYANLFQSPYFSFLKELHRSYNACISLFCFIQYNDFSLQKTTNKYAKDFLENKHWLRFGFHGKNECSRYDNEAEDIVKDYKMFTQEIERITGSKDVCATLRLHCFSGSKVALESLKQFNISNFLTRDITLNGENINYYLDSNQTHFINTHQNYKDIDTGISFYKSFNRIESLTKQDLAQENLNKHLMLYTHESMLLEKQTQNFLDCIYTQTKDTHVSNFPEVLHDRELKSFTTDSIKSFFDVYIPITSCNLKCTYCYITQQNLWFNKPPKFEYSPVHIARCLSKERLGGTCLFNMCGGGETLLHPHIIDIIQAVLNEGHYVWIVTNGTLTSRYKKLATLQKDSLYRLAFKFSFHYLELKRTKKLMNFVDNVKLMQDLGCSFSVEITPHDDLVEYIDEIKNFSLTHFGALPHITVARDETNNKAILTQYTKEEYARIWSSFNSELFKFKLSIFLQKRNEYCHAGKWSYTINMGDGTMKQCYSSNKTQNIFRDMTSSLKLPCIGVKCEEPHCYNGHAFLTLGVIPTLETPTYALMRNRVQKDGREWLNPYMKTFISHKLCENNIKDGIHKRFRGYMQNFSNMIFTR